MRIRIVSDGTIRNTKVINAETEEMIDNIKSFTIHADSSKMLVNATIEFVQVELIMVANVEEKPSSIEKSPVEPESPPVSLSIVPDEKKISRRYKTSTLYSRSRLHKYLISTQGEEGYSDLEEVLKSKIDADTLLGWYIWNYFAEKNKFNPKGRVSVNVIEDYLRDKYNVNNTGKVVKFHRTSINHTCNKFWGIGLLTRVRKNSICLYSIDRFVTKMGMDWFLEGNEFLTGNFQSKGSLEMLDRGV